MWTTVVIMFIGHYDVLCWCWVQLSVVYFRCMFVCLFHTFALCMIVGLLVWDAVLGFDIMWQLHLFSTIMKLKLPDYWTVATLWKMYFVMRWQKLQFLSRSLCLRCVWWLQKKLFDNMISYNINIGAKRLSFISQFCSLTATISSIKSLSLWHKVSYVLQRCANLVWVTYVTCILAKYSKTYF